MADYIRREAAVKVLTSIALEVPESKRRAVAKCINQIELLPAVDAVPVVRCRDCEYIYIDGYGDLICVKSGLYSDENDYCSRGQRRGQSADVRNMEEGNEHERAR